MKYVSQYSLITTLESLGAKRHSYSVHPNGKDWLIFYFGDSIDFYGQRHYFEFFYDMVIPCDKISIAKFKKYVGDNWKKLLKPKSYKKAVLEDEIYIREQQRLSR